MRSPEPPTRILPRLAKIANWAPLGLRGGAIGHINGDELSSPKFNPLWAKAEELGVLFFMHPQGIPKLDKRLAGNGRLGNVIGNPLENYHLPVASDLRRYA
jgi:hypothetical protein